MGNTTENNTIGGVKKHKRYVTDFFRGKNECAFR
jgi:hypothetical protein